MTNLPVTETDSSMPKFDIDTETLAKLADLLTDKNLTEIELGQGDRTVRLSRAAPAAAPMAYAPAPMAAPVAPAAIAEAAPAAINANAIKSPMVGTVYLSPQPGASAFVKPGDTVAEGQTLLIIEAMKVMNPIPSPRAGKVKEILVGDAQPVEFDQPLVIVE